MKGKRLKRLGIIALAAVTIMLSACGSNGEGNSKSADKAGNAEDVSQESKEEGISADSPYAGKGFDLSDHKDLVMYALSDRPAAMDAVLEKLNTEYLEPWLNVTLRIEFLPWGVASERYPLVLSGGDPVDLIYSAAWMNYASEVGNGAFMELTPEFLQKYLVYSYADQPETSWDQASIDGKIYGVPKSYAEFNVYNMALFRQDLLDKYKIGAIDSWDKLMSALLTIAENERENGIYANGQRGNDEMLYTWWQENDIAFLTSGYDFMYHTHNSEELPNWEEDVEYVYFMPEFYEYCVQMNELAAAGVWDPNKINDTTDVQMLFESGRVASMLWNASINSAGKNMENSGVGTYQIYDVTPNAKASRGSYADGMMSIPNNSKEPERAALVLDCIRGFQEVNLLLVGGIEGEHYTLTEEGYRQPGPKMEDYPWQSWAWGIQRYDEPVAYDEDPRQLYFKETCEAKEYQPKVAGFTFSPTNVETEMAVVNSVVGEYRASFTLGMFGDDLDAKYEEFLGKLRDAGIDKVMEECRAQYEAYCEGK